MIDFLGIYELIFMIVVLITVAFMYGSVGHGGASGYLALMVLFSFPVLIIKPTALLINVFVSAISFYFFFKNNYFSWKLFYPFAMASIPASFIGGHLTIDGTIYRAILAIVLIFATLRMLNVFVSKKTISIDLKLWQFLIFPSARPS